MGDEARAKTYKLRQEQGQAVFVGALLAALTPAQACAKACQNLTPYEWGTYA